MATIDSVKLPDNSTYDLTDNYSGYQKETLATPLNINGDTETTVEGALGGLNDYGDALADNLTANEENGAKNLAILDLGAIMPINTGGTWSGNVYTHRTVNFTVTDNGVSVSGTASGGAAFIDIPISTLTNGKEYIANGISGGADETYQIKFLNSSLVVQSVADLYEGERTFEKNSTNQNVELYRIRVASGANVTTNIYPMIRDARILDPTFTPYAETNLHLTRKTSGLSNENFLDNPFFMVNQRGATMIAGGYGADRWKCLGGTSLTFSVGQVTITNSLCAQPFENHIPNGTYTASVKLSDGNIYYGTATKVNDTDEIEFFNNNTFRFVYNYGGSGSKLFVIDNANVGTGTITVKSVKLELGSVSTLANDVAPNLTLETIKCQRYFYRIRANEAGAYTGIGYIHLANQAAFVFSLPTRFVSAPTITLSGTLTIRTPDGSTASASSITGVYRTSNSIALFVNLGSNLTQGNACMAILSTGGDYIDFSADL